MLAVGHTILSDVGYLSGGSWSASFPLSNVQARSLAAKARSTDAVVASTTLDVDLWSAQAVRVAALCAHNLSVAATYRLRGFTIRPVIDSYDFGTGWTPVGTPTRVAASYTSGGITLDKIGDDGAGAVEYYQRLAGWTGDGAKVVVVKLRKDTSTSTVVRVEDATAVAVRLLAVVTWTGTVANVAMTTGTLISSTLVGTDGVYRIVFVTTAGVVAANANWVQVMPATDAVLAVSATGDVYAGQVETYDASTDMLVYDTLHLRVFPAQYPAGSLPSYDARLVDGLPTAEEVADIDQATLVHVAAEDKTARYWRVDIFDAANAAGYVELGRLVLAPVVRISGPAYGAKLHWASAAVREETDGGGALHYPRNRRRVVTVQCRNIAGGVTLEAWEMLLRHAGLVEQVIFVWSDTDTYHMGRRAFLAILDAIDPTAIVGVGYHDSGAVFREEL